MGAGMIISEKARRQCDPRRKLIFRMRARRPERWNAIRKFPSQILHRLSLPGICR